MIKEEIWMKAIAYSIKPHERESLVLANKKKHDLTMISNELNIRTVSYAFGKQVLIISSLDIVDIHILRELKHIGISHLITRSSTSTNIDLKEAENLHIQISTMDYSDNEPDKVSEKIINHLDNLEKLEGSHTKSIYS